MLISSVNKSIPPAKISFKAFDLNYALVWIKLKGNVFIKIISVFTNFFVIFSLISVDFKSSLRLTSVAAMRGIKLKFAGLIRTVIDNDAAADFVIIPPAAPSPFPRRYGLGIA